MDPLMYEIRGGMGLTVEILVWIGGLLLGENHAREEENVIRSINYFKLMLELLKKRCHGKR